MRITITKKYGKITNIIETENPWRKDGTLTKWVCDEIKRAVDSGNTVWLENPIHLKK